MEVQVTGAAIVVSDKVGISGSIAGNGLGYAGGVNSISGIELDINELSALGSAALHQTQDKLWKKVLPR